MTTASTPATPTPLTTASLPDAHRTLPLRVEVARQFGRRRTKVALGIVVAIPLLLLLAFWVGGAPTPQPGERPFLGDLATQGGLNFALFALTLATQLLLVVIVALFNGDTIASEASWGSLRYLLALPVPRSRLLRQKLIVGLGYSAFASTLLLVVSLGAGTLAYGWHKAQTPLGSTISTGKGLEALLIITAYITASMLVVAAFAFLFSTMTDAPLGAVGSAVGAVIVSQILDAVTSLGSLRDGLPTHYFFSWNGVLQQPAQYGDMQRGMLVTLIYSTVLFALAWWNFTRKDITS